MNRTVCLANIPRSNEILAGCRAESTRLTPLQARLLLDQVSTLGSLKGDLSINNVLTAREDVVRNANFAVTSARIVIHLESLHAVLSPAITHQREESRV